MCVQDDYRAIESADDVFDTLVSLPYNTAPYSPSRAVTLRSYHLAAPPPHISYRVRSRSPPTLAPPCLSSCGKGSGESESLQFQRCRSIHEMPIYGANESDGTNGTVSSDLFYSVPLISPVKREARAGSSLSLRFPPRSPTRGAGRFSFPPLSPNHRSRHRTLIPDIPAVRYAFRRRFPYALFVCRRLFLVRYRQFHIYNVCIERKGNGSHRETVPSKE